MYELKVCNLRSTMYDHSVRFDKSSNTLGTTP